MIGHVFVGSLITHSAEPLTTTLGYKLIAHVAYCAEMHRMTRISLKFPPKTIDLLSDRV